MYINIIFYYPYKRIHLLYEVKPEHLFYDYLFSNYKNNQITKFLLYKGYEEDTLNFFLGAFPTLKYLYDVYGDGEFQIEITIVTIDN